MADTNRTDEAKKAAPTGANGSGNGARTVLGVRIDPQEVKKKALIDLNAVKEPTKTEVYKSIFRVKHDETARSRTLGVLSNVFLHLHPAKVNRDAVRYNFTWGMGGISFYLLDRKSVV